MKPPERPPPAPPNLGVPERGQTSPGGHTFKRVMFTRLAIKLLNIGRWLQNL